MHYKWRLTWEPLAIMEVIFDGVSKSLMDSGAFHVRNLGQLFPWLIINCFCKCQRFLCNEIDGLHWHKNKVFLLQWSLCRINEWRPNRTVCNAIVEYCVTLVLVIVDSVGNQVIVHDNKSGKLFNIVLGWIYLMMPLLESYLTIRVFCHGNVMRSLDIFLTG